MLYINEVKCVGCGRCIQTCQQGAISLQDTKAFINHELCIECGICRETCSKGAIYEVETMTQPHKTTTESGSMKVNTDSPLLNKKPSSLIKILNDMISVVIEKLFTSTQNRTFLRVDRNKRFCNRPGVRGYDRRCYRGRTSHKKINHSGCRKSPF